MTRSQVRYEHDQWGLDLLSVFGLDLNSAGLIGRVCLILFWICYPKEKELLGHTEVDRLCRLEIFLILAVYKLPNAISHSNRNLSILHPWINDVQQKRLKWIFLSRLMWSSIDHGKTQMSFPPFSSIIRSPNGSWVSGSRCRLTFSGSRTADHSAAHRRWETSPTTRRHGSAIGYISWWCCWMHSKNGTSIR